MISPLGLLDGLTASGIIISSTAFGLLSFYNARKLNAKLLAWAGLLMIFIGLLWLGPFVDFLLIIFTGKNIEPKEYYAWLSYIWVAPAIVIGMLLGSELMVPNKKKIIISIYGLLGILFEIIIFTNVDGTFDFKPVMPGDTIDASFKRTSIGFILVGVFLISTLIFEAMGFAIKAKQATGELRKKFTYLSLAFFIFVICGALDSIIPVGIAIGFIRVITMTFALWMYLGLKT